MRNYKPQKLISIINPEELLEISKQPDLDQAASNYTGYLRRHLDKHNPLLIVGGKPRKPTKYRGDNDKLLRKSERHQAEAFKKLKELHSRENIAKYRLTVRQTQKVRRWLKKAAFCRSLTGEGNEG
jgi:hypothetical protein